MFRSRALWAILALGLALRLLYGLAQDPLAPFGPTGGDDTWYLANALALVTDAPPGTAINGINTDVEELGQPPVFFLAAGIPQALLPPAQAVIALRIAQAIATTTVAFFGFGLAARLVQGVPGADARSVRRAGLITAAALALSPGLILESAQVKTESLYLFFIMGGLWAYVEAVVRTKALTQSPLTPQPPLPRKRGEGEKPHPPAPSPWGEGESSFNSGLQPIAQSLTSTPLPQGEGESSFNSGLQPTAQSNPQPVALPTASTPRPEGEGPGVRASSLSTSFWWLLAGVFLGLAALTRAVFLAFPLALVVFTPFALGWRPGWKRALLLLAVFAAVVLSWTVYNAVRYQRFVIAGEGLPSFLYLGATGWNGAEQVDERLEQALGPDEDGQRDSGEYLTAAGSAISSDVPGYLARRLRELGGAILQPHNVEVYAGESLRGLVGQWWDSDRSAAGLAAIVQGDFFWPKLLLYLAHVLALGLGILGMIRARRNWRVHLALLGFVAYTLLVHLFLYALPRYLFPIIPVLWVFAGAAFVRKEAASSELRVTSTDLAALN